MISGKFARYDYGMVGNKKLYGQLAPLEFNLGRINTPAYYFAGFYDKFAAKIDVLAMA